MVDIRKDRNLKEQKIDDPRLSRIVVKCWTDPAFKDRLLADPVAVLQAEGVVLPQGVQWRAVEDTEQLHHFVLPSRPGGVSDAELEQVAGGVMIHLYNDKNYIAQYKVNRGLDVIARLPRLT